MRITIKNKRTRELRVLSYEEFKAQFKAEFERAYQGFIRHETEKNAFLPEFMQKHLSEADFLLSLQWNFNNYSRSEWYILAIRWVDILKQRVRKIAGHAPFRSIINQAVYCTTRKF